MFTTRNIPLRVMKYFSLDIMSKLDPAESAIVERYVSNNLEIIFIYLIVCINILVL